MESKFKRAFRQRTNKITADICYILIIDMYNLLKQLLKAFLLMFQTIKSNTIGTQKKHNSYLHFKNGRLHNNIIVAVGIIYKFSQIY